MLNGPSDKLRRGMRGGGSNADHAQSDSASTSADAGAGSSADAGAEDEPLSLERLTHAFARAMGTEPLSGRDVALGAANHTDEADASGLTRGDTGGPAAPRETAEPDRSQAAAAHGSESATAGLGVERDVDARCPISPRSIAEAILFVGHPENQPLSSRMMAALMRGVSPEEVDEIVRQLNAEYETQQAPYEIAVSAGGYTMRLKPEFSRLCNKLVGRTRETRLSQAAIEVLALVAYNQPVGRERIDQLRGKPCAALLSQLVRRELLCVERVGDGRRRMAYRTTERFLDVFGLDSLDDLPQADSSGDPIEL